MIYSPNTQPNIYKPIYELYLPDFRSGTNGMPQQLYKLPSCPRTQRIEDTIICQCPLVSKLSMPPSE